MAPPEMRLGHVGFHHTFGGDPSGRASVSGVLRTFDAHVDYHEVKLSSDRWLGWSRTAESQQVFLPLGDASHLEKTLASYADDLRADPPSDDKDPKAKEFDEVMGRLFQLAHDLHELKVGLGLLSPESVLLTPNRLILVDHGFVYYDRQGPFLPSWLTNHPYAELWEDQTAIQHQLAKYSANFDPLPDVKLMARLCQGLLTGCWKRKILSGQELEDRYATRSYALWELLDTAEQGKFGTIKEFAQELQKTPLSGHFTGEGEFIPPEHSGGATNKTGRLSLAAIALVGVGAGLYLTFGNFAPDVSTVKSQSPSQTAKEQLPAADAGQTQDANHDGQLVRLFDNWPEDDLAGQLKLLQEADAFKVKSDFAKREITKRRGMFLSRWNQVFEEQENAFDSIDTRQEALGRIRELKELFGELRKLPLDPGTKEKEQQCEALWNAFKSNPKLPEKDRNSPLY